MSLIARLLCLMLVLLAALPAAQARSCTQHEAPGESMAMMAGHGAHHGAQQGAGHEPHKAPHPVAPEPRHDCVGCIAPIDLASYRPDEPAGIRPERTKRAGNAAYPASAASPPETPPPRRPV